LPDKVKFQAIKGVRDILPPESALWNRVEQTAREVFGTFGFADIRLPILESVDLFARAVGSDTDIVGKEMFVLERQIEDEVSLQLAHSLDRLNFIFVSSANSESVKNFTEELKKFEDAYKDALKRGFLYETERAAVDMKYLEGCVSHLTDHLTDQASTGTLVTGEWQELFGRSVEQTKHYLKMIQIGQTSALRPEATASVVRAYIEHGMQVLPGNVKLYYMGPMFRRERPQKGRYRQFYQIGAEVLGSSDAPGIDAEVIEMLMRLFERLKLKGPVLNINSIGDKNCRPAYVEKLRAELQKVREQLGPDSQRRIETNPLRVLDSKLESEQGIIENLPRIAEHLCADCRAHYDEVKRQLGMRGIKYQENWRLVRGLDYYMRTTFEITAPGLGSQNAVCGGGRYDGLVELLGGPAATKGIGFAIGTDRLVLSLQEAGEHESPGGPAEKAGGPDVYLAWFGTAAQSAAIGLARRLRDAGFVVELPAVEMKFGKSLGLADRLKARHAVIVGDDELAAGVVTVKRLSDGTQQKLGEPELFSYLRAARAT
jgi:histidyl-tRNA synthetase